MIHAGNAITVQMLADGIAEFRFDLQGESVNKFNRATIEDFQAAIAAVKANTKTLHVFPKISFICSYHSSSIAYKNALTGVDLIQT